MKLLYKLIASFILISVIAVFVNIISYYTISEVHHPLSDILEETLPEIVWFDKVDMATSALVHTAIQYTQSKQKDNVELTETRKTKFLKANNGIQNILNESLPDKDGYDEKGERSELIEMLKRLNTKCVAITKFVGQESLVEDRIQELEELEEDLRNRLDEGIESEMSEFEEKIMLTEGVLDSVQRNMTLISIAGVCVSVIIGFLLIARLVIKPIETITKSVLAFKDGKSDERLDINSKDELGVLSTTINNMYEELNLQRDSLETQVSERTQELESFSYSVSHDLRAPLRSIDGYTRILQEDYQEVLDEEGIRVLNIVVTNTKKMGQLIDDLLAFSRMGRKQLKKSEFDMNLVVRELTEDIFRDNPTEKIDIKINALPTPYGDMGTLRQVMANLISNAIKYSRNKEVSYIEIGGHKNGEAVTYFVKDNGVGFDMAYYDKLFGVFQRLHSVEEFEGNGIGLSIVKRVINKHSGEVWAEGELNKGAIFYFKLPIINNKN